MKAITEKMGYQKRWYKAARKMTVKQLPRFIRHLTQDYDHDYGTICHAVAAASIAAARAVDHSEQGGITGFQASCIMWEFIQRWMSYEDQPLSLLQYNNMLYPQYKEKFTCITTHTWKWLQEQSAKNLKDKIEAHPDVIKHWESIVSGKIPFGLGVRND